MQPAALTSSYTTILVSILCQFIASRVLQWVATSALQKAGCQIHMATDDGPSTSAPACYLIVYNVSKKHNIGTLSRAATAFNVKEVRSERAPGCSWVAAHATRALLTASAVALDRYAWWDPSTSTCLGARARMPTSACATTTPSRSAARTCGRTRVRPNTGRTGGGNRAGERADDRSGWSLGGVPLGLACLVQRQLPCPCPCPGPGPAVQGVRLWALRLTTRRSGWTASPSGAPPPSCWETR